MNRLKFLAMVVVTLALAEFGNAGRSLGQPSAPAIGQPEPSPSHTLRHTG
jgi:hypothetical protein